MKNHDNFNVIYTCQPQKINNADFMRCMTVSFAWIFCGGHGKKYEQTKEALELMALRKRAGFRPLCRRPDYHGWKQAAERVMKSATRYIKERLGLKVNAEKSKADKPKGIRYLGFGFYYDSFAKGYKARPHTKVAAKFRAQMKKLTCHLSKPMLSEQETPKRI